MNIETVLIGRLRMRCSLQLQQLIKTLLSLRINKCEKARFHASGQTTYSLHDNSTPFFVQESPQFIEI
jgi:hypothetical protein